MEKVSMEVDLDDWEFLPDEHHKGVIFSSNEFNCFSKGLVDVNYFIIRPSLPSLSTDECKHIQAQRQEHQQEEEQQQQQQVIEFKDIEVVSQDVVSQVFFKKWKEDEFVDKKLDLELDLDLDSPKSITRGSISALGFDEEEKSEEEEEEEELDEKIIEKKPCFNGFGITVWRWSLCTIGVAAATVCMLFLGAKPRPKQLHQSQRLQFQMYSDEQRIKQVVQQASRLNQPLSTMRGGASSPLIARSAHISFGGYYDAL
ncbi:uncharacterized protein LOC120278171 isoform X1 [Dioscorea cayenensis subsp. rotundata]|uniref:Uncharacterized protein LOC120278171 isoform X1 n=1 Tax=Dioscorea cayennensis subsp. rotundata TaxID=55577 RepID=A0AB40CLT2_DIOCR|nr:uncharacterized protein LOC120278171 isoform X1 [Dioscorea cayenensis subsp. rotundata]